jgi:hypothetical protein
MAPQELKLLRGYSFLSGRIREVAAFEFKISSEADGFAQRVISIGIRTGSGSDRVRGEK